MIGPTLPPIPSITFPTGTTGPTGSTGPTATICIRTDPNNGCSVAEGIATLAEGFASHAEGENTVASGDDSHAEGNFTIAFEFASHAEGVSSIAGGIASHAEGENTRASGRSSHAEGIDVVASGDASHAEGTLTTASGDASHAEGTLTTASGNASHAEGENTSANGTASHAEGVSSIADADYSHAEGENTKANGIASHAEGSVTTAVGTASHAEGSLTTALGIASHAEGADTTALGFASHAEGANTIANANYSHAEGLNTVVNSIHTGSHIMGQNGVTRFPFSWHLANGLAVGPSLNSAVIEGLTGNLYLDGTVFFSAAADYAEMFETVDKNPIDVGYFVTLDGDKIRKANANDNYILGVVSANPAMIADASDLRWHNLFVTDEWGRTQYHEVVVPEIKDDNGRVIHPSFTKSEPILNPEWDSSQEYIPRLQRPEWVPVGLVGKLLVRDDGTCKPKEYCRPNSEGIATASSKGYRVMKRTGPNQIMILVR
ncbi:peptidase G2 autoproteolytic cleavage domain-containing protein [Bacillus paranthracis]|uniref:peptidase G2 autoproteolytic cleavage domain-containing protein n=1 Tax=Bacillus paranthracis TaxID=2026186 RepID=UPI003D1B9F14